VPILLRYYNDGTGYKIAQRTWMFNINPESYQRAGFERTNDYSKRIGIPITSPQG